MLVDTIPGAELTLLLEAPSKTMCSLSTISEIIHCIEMDPIWAMQMQANVAGLVELVGNCERLLRTPIPLSYTRHTSRFLLLWLIVLPMALWSSVGWAIIPITGLVAMLLLGIEEIGVQIEEPFGVLALEVIQGIGEADVMDQLAVASKNKDYV